MAVLEIVDRRRVEGKRCAVFHLGKKSTDGRVGMSLSLSLSLSLLYIYIYIHTHVIILSAP